MAVNESQLDLSQQPQLTVKTATNPTNHLIESAEGRSVKQKWQQQLYKMFNQTTHVTANNHSSIANSQKRLQTNVQLPMTKPLVTVLIDHVQSHVGVH